MPDPKAPAGLRAAGQALWRDVLRGVPAGWELDERESALLALAAQQADDLARLDDAIRGHGAMVEGSQGQPVVNPAISEARNARLAISRLLGALAIPNESGHAGTEASRRGQRAARARWGHS